MQRRNFFKIALGFIGGLPLIGKATGPDDDGLIKVWEYDGIKKEFKRISWPDIKRGMVITFEDAPAILEALDDSFINEQGIYTVEIQPWDQVFHFHTSFGGCGYHYSVNK
jgi:hypothetical protein